MLEREGEKKWVGIRLLFSPGEGKKREAISSFIVRQGGGRKKRKKARKKKRGGEGIDLLSLSNGREGRGDRMPSISYKEESRVLSGEWICTGRTTCEKCPSSQKTEEIEGCLPPIFWRHYLLVFPGKENQESGGG